MSPATDIIFVRAIKSNASILQRLAIHDVYNTSIPLPDEDLDNAQIPYVIVMNDGFQNDESTKDDNFEGDVDKERITILIVARNRKELAELKRDIRTTVREFFLNLPDSDEDYDMVPIDYRISGGKVQDDALKPCTGQELYYDCEVKNDL